MKKPILYLVVGCFTIERWCALGLVRCWPELGNQNF
jgi:hypothetical protein